MKRNIMNSVCLSLLLFAGTAAIADTTINAANCMAYGANIGWVNARGDITNGAVMGQYACTGFVWSANCGWISLGNGPTNGWEYSNASSNDWGVNHDGLGNLSGMAYGANIGWITFEQTYGFPQIDLMTGLMEGYAYGANVGWISLSNAQAVVQTDRLDGGPDSDADGIPDPWEYREVGDLTILSDGGHDEDLDGSTDVAEYGADTGPLDDTSLLEITTQEATSLTNRLTWTVEDTRFYTVVENTNLLESVDWVDCGLGMMTPDPGGMMTRNVTVPPGIPTGTVSRAYGILATVPLGE